MALQKNIKEVESTEAGFVANAAAKNDGFLTDVIGYPMIKKRGNDYDYWFPEKSRDELGTYTYYDKTVKDLTALNDCIVQRRLSSYGDADTYLDLSTDDQAVLNVGGVPFLTVVESDSAAIGTLGGNLALGTNYLNYDGSAGRGVRFTSLHQLIIENTDGIALGDAKQMVSIREDTGNGDTGNGAGIVFTGNDGVDTERVFGGIKAYKENSITGDRNASVYIQTRANSSAPANALRLDSDQNGYIKNKLMVGSLDETPENQLVVYNARATDTFIQIANGVSGETGGLLIGLESDGDAVLNVGGVPFLTVAESGGAAIGTLGGNLALGANTISRDGAANKGFGVDATGIPTVTATAIPSGDIRTVLRLYDDTAWGEGVGAGINLFGKIRDDGTYANLGGIKISKENGVSGDYSSSFYIQTRKQGSAPANALRLDSDQNGYIKNKLMVGSLDETPENQLVVYNARATDTFIQVSNEAVVLGEGLKVGVEYNGDSVLRFHYTKHLRFQCEGYSGIKDMATLRYTTAATAATEFDVNGWIQCDAFRLDQDPIAGTITPDKYIIINCNGINYKIPVVAA